MIGNLLKRSSLGVFVCLSVLFQLASCKGVKRGVEMGGSSCKKNKQIKTKSDTIFFKKKKDTILEVVNKKEAHFFRVIIDSSSFGHCFLDYSTYQFTPNVYEPIETGNIQNIYELNPQKAIANGKWIIFGNDNHPSNLKYHKIGYYKQGIKDSIWYTNYEDGWSQYLYYKKGKPINYEGNVKFYGYKESLVAEGSRFRKDGLPIGIWKYYYNKDEVVEYEYIHKKDSILVKYINYDKKINKVIDKGVFIAAKYADEFEYREIEK
ncbi:hypothetical protein [Tenacibaculum ovolyticum]|uniref:hypothetical protein n=1 Tax=Tenacibaculum ovolyticum TaxID=104270 RepID=UPI0007ED3C45|nr:hypothetical protein [Tenacibaculum ovolyticum]